MIYFLESTLHLVLRLRGGAKKRKKKNYTTPKKIKHKHKKVKLAVLKYYKVSSNKFILKFFPRCILFFFNQTKSWTTWDLLLCHVHCWSFTSSNAINIKIKNLFFLGWVTHLLETSDKFWIKLKWTFFIYNILYTKLILMSQF